MVVHIGHPNTREAKTDGSLGLAGLLRELQASEWCCLKDSKHENGQGGFLISLGKQACTHAHTHTPQREREGGRQSGREKETEREREKHRHRPPPLHTHIHTLTELEAPDLNSFKLSQWGYIFSETRDQARPSSLATLFILSSLPSRRLELYPLL